MEKDQAFERLGLAPTTDRSHIDRAYAQAMQLYPQDTYPYECQSIREAYACLTLDPSVNNPSLQSELNSEESNPSLEAFDRLIAQLDQAIQGPAPNQRILEVLGQHFADQVGDPTSFATQTQLFCWFWYLELEGLPQRILISLISYFGWEPGTAFIQSRTQEDIDFFDFMVEQALAEARSKANPKRVYPDTKKFGLTMAILSILFVGGRLATFFYYGALPPMPLFFEEDIVIYYFNYFVPPDLINVAYALDYKDNESIQYVLEKTTTIKNDMDPPLIFQALETNNREIIRAMVAKGVSLEKETDRGFSVLQIALARGKFPLLQTLIELGADPHVANQWDSPITWCEKHGKKEWAEKMETWYQARNEASQDSNPFEE